MRKPITVERCEDDLLIQNGLLALRVPASGACEPPFPGPITAVRYEDGPWLGSAAVVGDLPRGRVTTELEVDTDRVTWCTDYRWGGAGKCEFRATWAAEADTIQIVETCAADMTAGVEWLPFAPSHARAWFKGGGEHRGPMEPAVWRARPPARATTGRRRLDSLGHISYFNQWCQSWCGFWADDPELMIGFFSGWGGNWQRRGCVRPEIWADDEHGHFLRLPWRRGQRCYGLVIARTRADSSERCLLNQRKVQLSDLAPAKVANWVLDPPPAGSGRLLPTPPADNLPLRPAAELLAIAEQTRTGLRDGGYECLIIFDGRRLKSIAFDFDALVARGEIDEDTYARIARVFLLAAYAYSDPDYCNYGDFWPRHEPDEGIVEALRDEMGDCPVPPNFASEFFSTVGVVAELFPEHPMASQWRQWTEQLTERFLETFFAADGTYHESINYHGHAISELLCWFDPLARNGGRDFYRHPAVRGSFEHFVQLQMPHLDAEGQAPLPANGNSGGDGKQQRFRGELAVAAAAYRQRNPQLAAQLMQAWHTGGKPVADHEHPALTAAVLDTTIEPRSGPWVSCQRQGLGVVSKATAADGAQLWALFRAGRATHHMDFDQGHLQLAGWGRELLGDHGYHTKDSDGTSLHAAATWLHSTLTYGAERDLSSGYTGLELAPEPARVYLSDSFDWVVHRIENTNHRDLAQLPYNHLLPAPVTVHVRHYLFVKPDYIVLWDTFEAATQPATWRLSPRGEVVPLDAGKFRAGALHEPHLAIQLVLPEDCRLVERRAVGPLWTLAVEADAGTPFLTVLVPQRRDRGIVASWAADTRRLELTGADLHHTVQLPAPGSTDALPSICRHPRPEN